jgi:hypothetical protein
MTAYFVVFAPYGSPAVPAPKQINRFILQKTRLTRALITPPVLFGK